MSETLREQIRGNLKSKDIYELLEIWRINNRVVWTDTTFEVLREILKERINEVPPQDNPILEIEEEFELIPTGNEWEEKILDSDDQPELYDPLEVIFFQRNVDRLSIVIAVFYSLSGLFSSQLKQLYLDGMTLSVNDIVIALPSIFAELLGILIQITLIYFPLKALAYILRILMEMEFNSRKAKS